VEYIIKATLTGLLFGTFGTTIGGIIGVNIKNTSKSLSFILEFAAGLMMGIICFELIPEALQISEIGNLFIGLLTGVSVMIICESLVNKKLKSKKIKSQNSLLTTGIIIGIGLAIHNFPEGLAIGSGFGASTKLGITLAVAILLHDIPEGVAIATPIHASGMQKSKALYITVLSGLTTGLGALFGAILGTVSIDLIAICLSFAAGAMLYIISGEIIPEAKKMYKGRIPVIGNILGFITGIIITM